MTEAKKSTPKKKGGKRFPRISLADAIKYSTLLVSKTHTGPQPRGIIFPGVFGASGPQGDVRASALRQYGLMDGKNDALIASSLAKDIVAAPPDELRAFLVRAALNAVLFEVIFKTFKADKVSDAKIKQQAAQQGVHPDLVDLFTSLCLESLGQAELVESKEGLYSFAADEEVQTSADSGIDDVDATENSGDTSDEIDEPRGDDDGEDEFESTPNGVNPGVVINLNVSLDSSLDTDKLERQLQLLRQYGLVKGPKK